MFCVVIKDRNHIVYLRQVDMADGGAYLHWCENQDSAEVFRTYEEAKAIIDDCGLDEDGATVLAI